MCPKCKGLGVTQKVDLDILIENENLSILDGALKWFGSLRDGKKSSWPIIPLSTVFEHYDVDIEKPWNDLPEEFRNIILYGSGDEKIEFPSAGGKTVLKTVKGVASEIERLYFDTSSLNDVGLHYLTLNRTAPTLSGGEGQRVRLANALSSDITGITYVLDEPSTWLHPRDTENLIKTLYKLRDNGNTVIVVEHDEEIIKSADYIVDIGPYAGVLGGKVIGKGSLDDIRFIYR